MADAVPARPVSSPGARRRPWRALLAVVGALVAVLLPAAAAVGGGLVGASTAPGDETVDITLFWGRECPKCEAEREWLDDLADDYDLNRIEYEVWHDGDNRELFEQTAADLGFEAGAVPTTIIGERVWIGYTDSISEDIAGAVQRVSRGESVSPGVYGQPGTGTCDPADDSGGLSCDDGSDTGAQIDVPLVGTVALDDQNLLVSTLIIGFVDGVNPCSLWVISVLLTIVVRTASRRRVIAIGSAFLLVTAGMYALYMAGIYSALTVVGFLGTIQIIVAVAAGVFGLVSVKDYFAFKKGLSFTIPDSAKPGIYKRMRAAAGHERLLPALLATGALGVAVSLIETPCTAGFPVLWTGLLKANGIGFAESALLFVAYMVPFLLDEMIVFAIAVFTMKATKMQEKHGELLKLFAGVTMLALAAVMVADPTLMENPVAAALLFAAAFVLAWVVHVVTMRVRASRASAREAAEA
ncbi:hypothetical protein [Actinotalea fermentans]|uniref:Membrane protein n=1 Tax=Actinotalea fermentans TaxID=43671 RepID=A0A511YXX8_9CELL|nr:hypothetical protein [Actinotalea fermentans]KGM15826.1 hypothetical protein N867_05310 [Actinotalea fermentans ATCC 43279 = JCM 9966 = DSM 3133]GEN80051.1 membrane protein [Actinotalea fermentans]